MPDPRYVNVMVALALLMFAVWPSRSCAKRLLEALAV